MGDNIILNLDESGNLGKSGKFFTIACIETNNTKPLNNVMKKTILKTKKVFTEFEGYKEIKASDAYPSIKDFFLRKIISKENIYIRYIVADKEYVKPQLLKDENLLYNYMLQFLILPVAKRNNVDSITINIDKRTIKVKSTNSFEDYIKIKLLYEHNIDIDLSVNYYESHNNYSIQAADFIANVVNSKYEYDHDYYYNIIKHRIIQTEHFPRQYFGTKKIVNM